MSRARVAEYVTQLIWGAMAGMLREAGIVLDPGKPFPSARPAAALHALRGDHGRGDDGRAASGSGC